jgi:hypothetical protein
MTIKQKVRIKKVAELLKKESEWIVNLTDLENINVSLTLLNRISG